MMDRNWKVGKLNFVPSETMCYHKSLKEPLRVLASYYDIAYDEGLESQFLLNFHENGFEFGPTPLVTAESPDRFIFHTWGLIPWWTKSLADAARIRAQTLNAISEEMFSKPSYRDSLKAGKRCLIPCTGFFEWQWQDAAGKSKIPYFIRLRNQEVFSLAGIYSRWVDKETGLERNTYSVLTTQANELMSEIHNSKKRMPVIIPRNYERDFLNPNLKPDDVLALCSPFDSGEMTAYSISKNITSRKMPTNVPEILTPVEY